MITVKLMFLLAACLAVPVPARAQQEADEVVLDDSLQPFKWLIGEWLVELKDGHNDEFPQIRDVRVVPETSGDGLAISYTRGTSNARATVFGGLADGRLWGEYTLRAPPSSNSSDSAKLWFKPERTAKDSWGGKLYCDRWRQQETVYDLELTWCNKDSATVVFKTDSPARGSWSNLEFVITRDTGKKERLARFAREWLELMTGQWEVRYWEGFIDSRTDRPSYEEDPTPRRCTVTKVGEYLVFDEETLRSDGKWHQNKVSVIHWDSKLNSLIEHPSILGKEHREKVLRCVNDRGESPERTARQLTSVLEEIFAQSTYLTPNKYANISAEQMIGTLPAKRKQVVMGGWPVGVHRLSIQKTETGFYRQETDHFHQSIYETTKTEYRRAAWAEGE
jgi:hypothetical protein